MRHVPDALRDDDDDEVAEPTRVREGRGRELGRYRLFFELASGGMGTVYLARDTAPGGSVRAVAIKRIHPHLARDRKLVTMFLDEARIASRIEHPNVCTVYDFGEIERGAFLAMEYLLGEPASAVVRAVRRDASRLRTRRWIEVASSIVRFALEGLHAAHELRDEHGEPLAVVHRDVSPQNLFVTFDGVTKVVDFGVAFARDREHRTRTGAGVKGKLSYMAPEQAAGEVVDRRVDVWAAGVCLWEMLTGERLFRRATDLETMRAIESAEVEAPSARNTNVPEALDALVLRALERDRERRWPSARAMADALGALAAQGSDEVRVAATAAWMGELFPEEQRRKQRLVREVLGAPAGLVLDLHAQPTVRLPAVSADMTAADATAPTGALPADLVAATTERNVAPDSDATVPLEAVPEELARAIEDDLRRIRAAHRSRVVLPAVLAALLAAALLALVYVALVRGSGGVPPPPPAAPAAVQPSGQQLRPTR